MLTTCLWSHDNRATEMAEFYTSIFPDSRITTTWLYDTANEHLPGSKKWDVMIVEFSLMDVSFATLNGWPYFHIDPSISFFVSSSDRDEISKFWEKLSEWGKSLMALGAYPWSERYGWIEDKYGVSWQLFFSEKVISQCIAPCLSFTKEKVGKTEEAIAYYTSVFPESGTNILSRYEEWQGGIEWYIKHAQFHLGDFVMSAMDAVGPHKFDFSCAVSFMISCESQEKLDYFYEKLSAVPEAEMCGWVCDKFWVSWQLIPANFALYMRNGEDEKKSKLMKTVMEVRKLSWKSIEDAYNS